MNFIDLFSGSGGLSEGFIKAGFNPIAAHVEIDSHACNTFENRLVYHKLKEENKLGNYYDYLLGKISMEDYISKFWR
jgi:DNA (cytosine-5)-methyltransferase 1